MCLRRLSHLRRRRTPCRVANSGLVVYVDNVVAHYERARAAGARIDSQPVDQPYGQREYGARDPEGHRWYFVTPTPSQG